MKKIRNIFAMIAMVMSMHLLSACGNTNGGVSEVTTMPNSTEQETSNETTADLLSDESDSSTEPLEKKILVVYFSWSGNTEEMATYMSEKLDADIFRLEPATPYPTEYTPCTEVAKAEKEENARPEIKELPEDLSEYDTIYLGYPIWWHTAPMLIGTFLESNDFDGIDIYPFTQSSSMDEGQFEESMAFIRTCAPNAIVHDGLFAKPSDKDTIDQYLK